MKRRITFIFSFLILALLMTVFIFIRNQNDEVLMMNEVNLDHIDKEIIGSEPPKIIYADSENIIIDCRGVYIYNITNQTLTKTFDVLSFLEKSHPDTFYSCFAVKDGTKIIFCYSNLGESTTYYCYSLDSDTFSKIEDDEYTIYRENVFSNSTNLKINNVYATYISDTEYVYLLSPDLIVGNIIAVYVKDSEETHYPIFQ